MPLQPSHNPPAITDDSGFDDEAWLSVLNAMEASYIQSIEYQTEIEEKNEALDQSNQFISEVISSMSDILIVTDDCLSITKVNTAFLKMTSYEETDVIGRSVETFIFFSGESPEKDVTKIKNFQDIRVTLQGRFNKIPLTISCNCAPTCSSEFKGRVIVGRPIGEILQAYEALQSAYQELAITKQKMIQAERLASLGRLVAGVAHELNTPISVLQGNLWALKQLHEDIAPILQQQTPLTEQGVIAEAVEDLPGLLQDSQAATEQIGHIVKSLKAFNRQESEGSALFNVAQSVELAVDWAVGSRPDQMIKVSLELDENLQVMGADSKFQQVMINLLQNAMDALSKTPHPHIHITSLIKDQRPLVLVEDNGTGIPEDIINTIFDPFFTTKAVGKGTGLGLGISYQLLMDMGATLRAWNKVDKGAIFEIDFGEGQANNGHLQATDGGQ